ncbi:hypothetical protein [Burkholderia pseudomallei]|uniref:hypothetical protein n=1 Tax=Burkholderia pseudomallei TaxID=28450 RepID=UPI00016B218B|nr:hypothetical protein [Burkholderia pseudomallei]
MIAFTLNYSADPEMIELRTGSVDTNLAAKPPLIIRRDQLQMTLLCLLRAAQAGSQPIPI